MSKTDSLRRPARRLVLRSLAAAAGTAVAWGLAGCGGGDTPAAPQDTLRQPLRGVGGGGTGIAMALFVSGPVVAVAPLTVQGTEFDDSLSVRVDADGQLLDAVALAPGMVCQISATPATSGSGPGGPLAQAQLVRVADALLATVDTVDAASTSFTALGQTVVVTGTTVFGPSLEAGLAAVQAGQRLQVWGELDTAGARIVATRVALAPATASAAVVRGVVTALDRTAGLASIGRLQLSYTASEADVVGASVAVGSVVRARLTPDPTGLAAALWSMRTDELQLPDRVQAELEGRVTRVDSSRRFAVDGVEVNAANVPTVLTLGQRVAVAGRSVNGVVMASSVQAERDEPVEMQGSVVSSDAQASSFVLKGVTVVWSADTVFRSGTAAQLGPSRRVELVGRWLVSGSRLLATRIQIED
jgi:hypothetical protein